MRPDSEHGIRLRWTCSTCTCARETCSVCAACHAHTNCTVSRFGFMCPCACWWATPGSDEGYVLGSCTRASAGRGARGRGQSGAIIIYIWLLYLTKYTVHWTKARPARAVIWRLLITVGLTGSIYSKVCTYGSMPEQGPAHARCEHRDTITRPGLTRHTSTLGPGAARQHAGEQDETTSSSTQVPAPPPARYGARPLA